MDVPWGYAYFLAAFYRAFGDTAVDPAGRAGGAQCGGAAADFRARTAHGATDAPPRSQRC